jgi:carboxyl-terminal processing protease
MSRERLAWLVSIVLLAILAFELPGTLAQRDDDYSWVRTLVEVERQIANNYVEPVDAASLKQNSIKGMLGGLDQFTQYIPPVDEEIFDRMLGGTFPGVGISLLSRDHQAVVATPIPNSPAARAGIDAGDILVKVNGESIAGLSLDDVVKKVSGPVGTFVNLTVQRDGKDLDFSMKRQEIAVATVEGCGRSADDSWNYFVCDAPRIGYVRITQFEENSLTSTFDELKKAMTGDDGNSGLIGSGMQGLILDLRFNPGGQLDQAIKIVNLFVKSGVIVTTKGRARAEKVEHATGEGTLPDFPMIVLVNDYSASAAEIVSGSLKDNHRALVVGQRTYGKGSVQERIPLDEGGELKLTVAYYYLPSGRLVQRKKDSTDWGVEPQIIVPADEKTEEQIKDQFLSEETIRRPITRPATQPSTQPVDPQLQQALNTMIGLIELGKTKPPTTSPSTAPAAQ